MPFSYISYKHFNGKPDRKRPLGWEDNKMDHMKTGWDAVDRSHMTENRDWWQALVNTKQNTWVL
jgi:hypothetical protein